MTTTNFTTVATAGAALPADRIVHTLDNCDLDSFLRIAADFGTDRYGYVVTPNVDHMIRFHDSASFRAAYAAASHVLLDSRFAARLFRLVHGVRVPVCTGSDLTARLFEQVIASTDRIVLIGASEAQAAALARRYGLQDLRHHNPPMGFANDPAAVEQCLRFAEEQGPCRFLLLAVGSPRQEMLAQRLQERGRARGLALCIGASVDFLTGGEKRAPAWIQSLALEWLYRLLQNPRRMAHRYLVRGPRFFTLLWRESVVLRKPRP